MFSSIFAMTAVNLSRNRGAVMNIAQIPKTFNVENTNFTIIHPSISRKKSTAELEKQEIDKCKECRKAYVDTPKPVDPLCPKDITRKKKKGILYKIKLKIIEGGTNFGTPFRKIICKKEKKKEKKEEPDKALEALPEPKREMIPVSEPDPGVQVAILGAESMVGQYVALLLKQCPAIRKLRLYDAMEWKDGRALCEHCIRDTYKVAQDLQHIDTNCTVQAFSANCGELNACLQNTDIVLMLESSSANINKPFNSRFESQAPLVKKYADAIAQECPKAFIICCATPIDCMVPLIAETLKETGWYDRRKLMGSIAVPEMRASTLAARALTLEPRYTRVPCVGGTEGDALVPLFSKAIQDFDFARHNAEMMTTTVRMMPWDLARCQCCCLRTNDLSEAHALANLVKCVAHALLCMSVPKVSGFVETDSSQILSPARYLALDVLLNKNGILKRYDLPGHLSALELDLIDSMWDILTQRVCMAHNWYHRQRPAYLGNSQIRKDWHEPRHFEHLEECQVHLT